jgi:hypothetical protein
LSDNKTLEPAADSRRTERRRRWLRRLIWALIASTAVALGLVAAGPWLVANTPLRHAVVKAVLANDALDATVDQLGCGWFQPLHLAGLRIKDAEEQLHVDIQRLQFDKSWLLTWLNVPLLGSIHLDQPVIDITVSPESLAMEIAKQEDAEPLPVTLDAAVKDATLRIRTPERVDPVIALTNVDLKLAIAEGPHGRCLSMEPFTVFADENMTSDLCDQGLQLVAPVLSNAMRVEGRVTLDLDEVYLPLDIEDPEERLSVMTVAGRVKLEQVKTGLKNPLLVEVAELVSKLLKVRVPQTVEIADDTSVAFELRDGRVYHEGLVFWLPELSKDIKWQTSGTVGLDESLDLTVQAQLPLTLVHEGPLVQRLAQRPLKFNVTGTLKKPKLELFKDRNWITGLVDALTSDPERESSPDPAAESADRAAVSADRAAVSADRAAVSAESEVDARDLETGDPLTESIIEAVGNAVDVLTDPDRPTPLLDRMKQRREERLQKKAERRAEEEPASEDEKSEKPRLFRGGLFRKRERK